MIGTVFIFKVVRIFNWVKQQEVNYKTEKHDPIDDIPKAPVASS
jgi:hypothetical protein